MPNESTDQQVFGSTEWYSAASRQMDDPAREADRHGFRSIRGLELLQDMQHVHLDGPLRSTEQGTDLPVGEPSRHEREHFDLSVRQVDPWRERCQATGDVRGNASSARMDLTNAGSDGIAHDVLEEIAPRSGRECAMNVRVAVPGGQRNDPGVGKLTRDRSDGVDPAHDGHAEVHERDVRSVLAESLDGLASVHRLDDQLQIAIGGNE